MPQYLRIEKDGQKLGVALVRDNGGDVDFYGLITDGAGVTAPGEGIYASVEDMKTALATEYVTMVHESEFTAGKAEVLNAGE